MAISNSKLGEGRCEGILELWHCIYRYRLLVLVISIIVLINAKLLLFYWSLRKMHNIKETYIQQNECEIILYHYTN